MAQSGDDQKVWGESSQANLEADADTFTPLTIPEQIAVQIAREILNGKFEVGDKLSEYKLADRFNVSRGPIRHAITILERNSFVHSTPRTSTRVNSMSRHEVEQLFAVRAEVLGLLGSYAARNARSKDIEQLGVEVAALKVLAADQSDDLAPFYLQSHRCWAALSRASHAKTLSQINMMITSSPLWQVALQDRMRQAGIRYPGSEVVSIWTKLRDAIAAHDETTARNLARSITQTTWSMISRTFTDVDN